MKKILFLALALTFCLMLCACGAEKSEDTAIGAFSGGYTYEESFEQDGKVYLTVKVEYPKMEGEEGRAGEINAFFKEKLDREKEYIKSEIEPMARETAGYLAEDQSCAYEVKWERQRLDADCLSVLCTTYRYLGGVHPGQSLAAYNFDKEGGLITADRLFGMDHAEYSQRLRTLVLNKVDNASTDEQAQYDGYFEGWRDNMMDYWQPDDFLITDDGITIFWQEYAIAPYAAGMPRFDLSWEELEDMTAEEWRQ